MKTTAYGEKAQIYIADAEDGAFLLDTRHGLLGNISDPSLMSRPVKPGFDYAAMKEDFYAGRSGYFAFWSPTLGEYFYSHYMPVGVGRWMVQLTVPETIVFADARRMRTVFMTAAGIEIGLLVLYLAWILRAVRHDRACERRRLEQTVFMYDIQHTLFDAHLDPLLFNSALEKVSLALGADGAAFFISRDRPSGIRGRRLREPGPGLCPLGTRRPFGSGRLHVPRPAAPSAHASRTPTGRGTPSHPQRLRRAASDRAAHP